LQAYGDRVVEATGGGHALEILRREPVDVALVDLRMPGFDGFDFLRAWREACAERYVPVVLVTGSSAPADVAAGLGLGAQDCVRKPFQAVELLARVGAALVLPRGISTRVVQATLSGSAA
jgi:DNA-binding response OmpR family regulator